MRILLVIAACFRLTAATYYVDWTGGNDSSTGTSSGTAWKTLGKVATSITAGDTVLLKRGETWTVGPGISGFTIPANNVTLDAYGSGAQPIVDGQSTTRRVIDCGTAVGTITRNLHIRNGGPFSGQNTGANWLSSFGTNTIDSCTVESHASDACVDAGDDGHIVVLNCEIFGAFDDGVTLHTTASLAMTNCVIRNNGQGINHSGTDMTMSVDRCTFQDNAVDLDALTACTSTFTRCLFRGRTGGSWTFFKGSDLATTFNYCIFDGSRGTGSADAEFTPQGPGATTANNCVFFGGAVPAGNISLGANTLVMNNCIVSSWWRAASLGSGTFNSTNTIFHSVTTGTRTSESGTLTSNPLFVSPSTGNFRLQAGSPAINSGISVGLSVDYAGATVGATPERGAYEYLPNGSATATTVTAGNIIVQ